MNNTQGQRSGNGGPIQNCEYLAPATQNQDFKFSKISGDSDFHLMISRDQEEVYKKMSDENADLKECLKMLQRELLEVVSLKQDVFTKRFKAEFGAHKEPGPETEEVMAHQIEAIREELFNVSFEESGKDLVQKFKLNF